MSEEKYSEYLKPAKEITPSFRKRQNVAIFKRLAAKIDEEASKGKSNCYFLITENLLDKSLPVTIISELEALGYKASILDNTPSKICISIFWHP